MDEQFPLKCRSEVQILGSRVAMVCGKINRAADVAGMEMGNNGGGKMEKEILIKSRAKLEM